MSSSDLGDSHWAASATVNRLKQVNLLTFVLIFCVIHSHSKNMVNFA